MFHQDQERDLRKSPFFIYYLLAWGSAMTLHSRDGNVIHGVSQPLVHSNHVRLGALLRWPVCFNLKTSLAARGVDVGLSMQQKQQAGFG